MGCGSVFAMLGIEYVNAVPILIASVVRSEQASGLSPVFRH